MFGKRARIEESPTPMPGPDPAAAPTFRGLPAAQPKRTVPVIEAGRAILT